VSSALSAPQKLRPTWESFSVFPTMIKGEGWSNIDTIGVREQDESAVWQNFSNNNSASLNFANYGDLEETTSPNIQSNSDNESDQLAPEATATMGEETNNVSEISATTTTPIASTTADLPITTETVPVDEIVSPIEEAVTEVVPAEVIPTEVPPAEAVPSLEPTIEQPVESLNLAEPVLPNISNQNPEQNPVVEPEAPPEPISSTPAITPASVSSNNFLKELVWGVFPLTKQIFPLTQFSTTASTVQETEVIFLPQLNIPSTTENSYQIDFVNDVATSENSLIEGVEFISTSTTDILPITPTSNVTAEKNSLTLKDFSLPTLKSGQVIQSVQLRLSLGGNYIIQNNTDLSPALAVTYQVGSFSGSAGEIILDGEISNAMNGGYYLLSLPVFSDPKLLSDLSITISYKGDVSNLKSLYLDAVWLDIDVISFDKQLLENRYDFNSLNNLDKPDTMEFLSNKIDFSRDEIPQFTLKYLSQRNFIVKFFRQIFSNNLADIKSVTFIHGNGDLIGVSPILNITNDGLISIILSEADKVKLKPGEYTVKIEVDEGGYLTDDSFAFQWGLLSINTNKTEYNQNENVAISMGALSSNGNTVCDANLNLYVTSPQGFVSSIPVSESGLCFGNNIVNVPDYSTQMVVTESGDYQLTLERLAETGEIISHTTKTFSVVPDQKISIERNGPTRIFPPAPYPMTLTVKSVKGFSGELIERVPNNFIISKTNATIRKTPNAIELVWQVDLSPQVSQTFRYEFDAPDLSPYLYEMGPAELVESFTMLSLDPTVLPEPFSELSSTSTLEATSSSLDQSSASTTVIANKAVNQNIPVSLSSVSLSQNTRSVFLEQQRWQIASDATGNMILFWDNGASIPAGWSCLSCGSGTFFQRFAEGGAVYNTTGGAITHTPGATGVVNASALATTNGAGTSGDIVNHTHTYTPVINAVSNLPLYRQLRVVQYNSAGEPATIPAGAIGIFDVASSSLPAGWFRYSNQDGYYIRGEDLVGATGGANTHTHTISGTTGASAGTNISRGKGASQARTNHTHTVNSNTPSINSEPPYIEVLLGKISADGPAPNDLITMWTDAVPTGWTDVSSGGADPFNGRYLKASTTYGTIGGAVSHTHADVLGIVSSVPNSTKNNAVGASGASGVHTHLVDVTNFTNTDNRPPYLTVIFGKRADFSPRLTQESYKWYVNTDNLTPMDVWPVGGTDLLEAEPITATSSPIKNGEKIRLRINSSVTNVLLPVASKFILQYGVGNDCSLVATWIDVGASTSTDIWRGFDNNLTANHSTIASLLLATSTIAETYEEDGYATGTPNSVPVSGVGEWDFIIQNNGAATGTEYCFRMVKDNGQTFFTYNTYPKLLTNHTPTVPTLINPFSNEEIISLTPAFDFFTTDPDNDDVEYEIIVDDNFDFSSPVLTKQSANFPTDQGWTASTASSSATTTYTVQIADSFSNGVTYWWKVRARDLLGSNEWSDYSSVNSFTPNNILTENAWYQTLGYQFETNTLNNIATTTGTAEIATLGFSTSTITNPSAWAQQYASVNYPAGTINANYTVSAGTDRVLVVAVASTRTTAGSQTISVTYGGQALTMATGDDTNTVNWNHTYLFYLNDQGLQNAVGTNLSATITGGASYYTYVYAGVFAGVDQTSIYTDARNFNDSVKNNAFGPFSSGLMVGEGDQAIEIANVARSGNGNTARVISTWSNTTWPNPSTVATAYSFTSTHGLGLHINNRNVTTAGVEPSQHTANSNGVVDSLSGLSLKVAVYGATSTIMSNEIDHDLVPNKNTWGEVEWNTTEPTGSDILLHLYYSNVTTCDTIIPDGALVGNSAGFAVTASPLNISGLSTSTYNRICLNLELQQGTSVTSPTLDDWAVKWDLSPQFSQADYRFYVNNDGITPTDPWSLGAIDLDENTTNDVDSAILPADKIRLRLSLTATSTTATAGAVAFKLQFAPGDICSPDLSWQDVGGIGSTTALWRGYNNPTVTDGSTLSSTLLTTSNVAESYEEQNNSSLLSNAINIGEKGEWDFVLQNNLAAAGTNYCFRMTYTDGSVLSNYSNYPILLTNSAPGASALYNPFTNEMFASTTPWFEFASVDPEGNELDYQIQIDNNADFSSTLIDTNSISNITDFSNQNTPADKSPFNNAEKMRYTLPTTLSNGVTYWWRVRAKDVNGSNNYGSWSTANSFTVNTAVTVSNWFQTTEAQFDTDTLEGTDATVANVVAFASGSTTGTTTSTAINFSDATIGNAWGLFSFNETGAPNDILYHLEYYSNGNWNIIPDTALAGNTAGFDVSPVNLLDLDTATYNIIRIRANFSSGTPTILDWTVSWGERVSVVTTVAPFDNEKFSNTLPILTFHTTDPQNDNLEYEVSWSTDYSFTASSTRNSSSSAGFSNLTNGGDINPFNSGDTISYALQGGETLNFDTTYWWRVRAKDPSGSNSFSFWSEPGSFTTATSGQTINVSTWHQTLGQQFSKGTLVAATTTAGTVEIGDGITIDSNFTSNTALTTGATITLTKPANIVSGDLLLIIVGNDDNTNTAQWNNSTLKPTGFTMINEAGSKSPDAHVAAFYRLADGTEGATVAVPSATNADYWGYYMRITGVDQTNPIDVLGVDYLVNNLASHAVTALTTTVPNTLAFYVLSADGGDTFPFSVSGTGWIESAEIRAGVGATNSAGTWGTRAMATAGNTGVATVAMNVIDGASGFQFALTPATITSGTLTADAINFDTGSGPAWGQLAWTDVEPGTSQILYQIEYLNAIGNWELIPDSALTGNATGFTISPINLETLNTTTYHDIRLLANLNCSVADCPILNDWTLEWSRGFTVSGTALEYDGIASTTAGTVALAVNGNIQLGKTGTIDSNGNWIINDATFYSGDVITVFVSGAGSADEAVAVTKYDGVPDITGMKLIKRHLTIGSADNASLTNQDLSLYDFTMSGDDVFYNVVNAGSGYDLNICADVGCADAGLIVLTNNTYVPGTSADLITHDIKNDGVMTFSNNILRVSGSWDNNTIANMGASTVIMTATSTTETIDSTGASVSSFYNLTLGETSGTATFSLSSDLTATHNLTVTYGTLARTTLPINIVSDLTIGANGYLTGTGTTTFNGNAISTWSDANATKQNIGEVVVNGTAHTLLLGSNTLANSLTIASGNTFDLSNNNRTVQILNNWTNAGTFEARNGKVSFIATSANKTITTGGASFYNLDFAGSGGSWSFVENTLTVGGNFTLAIGTVTLPSATTTIAGSFTNTGGTFVHNNGTVKFTATSAKTITMLGTTFSNGFYDLSFTGSGSWTMTDTNATSSHSIIKTAGTLTLPSGTLAVGGSFLNTGGTLIANNGDVEMFSTNPQTITLSGSALYHFNITGSGSVTMNDTNATIAGDLSVSAGELLLPTGTLTLSGSLINTALITPQNGTILFNATALGKTISSGNSSLNNIIFNSVTGGWTILDNATTTADTTLTAGSFTLATGKTLAVGGVFTNNIGGASTTWSGSTLLLSAGAYSINTKTTGGDNYDNLTLLPNVDIKMWNSSATTTTVAETSSLYSQDHNATDGELYIWGDYQRTTGTEHWDYATDFDGTILVGSERQVRVKIATSSVITIASSSLSLLGDANASTTISAQGGGNYTFIANNTTINARYFTFNDSDINGLQLTGSTTLSQFADGSLNVTPTFTALTIDNTTVDANSAQQFLHINFATTTVGLGSNVTLIGSPNSFIWFKNGSGNIYGEDYDVNDSNPGAIRFDDSAYLITVSGTVYADAGLTPLLSPTCDGVTNNVRVVVDGGSYASSTSCSAVDGTYSLTGVAYVGDPKMVVYLDTNGGEKGSVVTKTPTADITDLDIYAHRVIVRHEDVTALSIADMVSYDENDDSDLSFLTTMGTPNTLVLEPNTELFIFASSTFTPDGNVTLNGNGNNNDYEGTLALATSSSFIAQGNEVHTLSGRLVLSNEATLSTASSTFIFTATTTGKSITANNTLTFNEIDFTGVGGAWNITAPLIVLADMHIATGIVTATNNLTLANGSLYGDGLFSQGAGTVEISSTNTLGGTNAWTFNNLTLGSGVIVGTTTVASSATTSINGVLTIGNAHTLVAGTSKWDLTSTGNPLIITGTFAPDSSSVRYSGANANITATTFYNLILENAVGNAIYTALPSGLAVLHNLTIGGDASTTADFNTNDPVVTVTGDVAIALNGTLLASASSDLNIAGNYSNNGILTANNGSINFTGSGSKTISAGASSFATLNINGTGGYTLLSDATTTANFTLASTSNFTLTTGKNLAVGGTFTNNSGGLATTWTGSTLSLYGGANYLINNKTISDSYENILVGANTDIRMWNSTATAVTVDTGGSLYSMDQGGVDGSLFIYGSYENNSTSDYWSYATDFDGTDLTGSERQTQVYISALGSVLYQTNGDLAIIGIATASTTIQNQGSGVYSLTIGNSGSTTMKYYDFLNLDNTGLNFTGAPVVNNLSFGRIEVANTAGSAMTVAGSAINANPAKTFTNNIFATSSGVTSATNVTATSSSVSSWRFTNHSGSIAGEVFDSDPAGDPGYIVWDDSAALITVAGNVYSDEGTTVSGACDGTTNNIRLVVAGLTTYDTSCAVATGAYSISNVAFSPLDTLTLYINGEVEKAVNVSMAPISSISDMHLYENRVIVRHENTDPLTIANMAIWDSSDDADISFTAVDAGTDTLTLSADTKLLIWASKTFEPNGNVTLSGGGAGADYDGTLEAQTNATFRAKGTETHSIGGSIIFDTGAVFTSASSTLTLTTTGASRTLAVNNASLHNLIVSGSGSYVISDNTLTLGGSYTQSSGAVTFPTGTTTIGADFNVTGGSFTYNNSPFVFISAGAGNTVHFNNYTVSSLTFTGTGTWNMTDTDATSTGSVLITGGGVTLPSGSLAVGGSFQKTAGTLTHNTSDLIMTATSSALLTVGSADLYAVRFVGAGSFTITDSSITLLDSLEIATGTVALASTTTTVGGSFIATGGTFTSASGTVLFNASASGKTINPGSSTFYNLQIGAPAGGYTLYSATTTNNFTISSINSLLVNSGATVSVLGVFSNSVGGTATTWANTILYLNGQNTYSINTRSNNGDNYETLMIGANSDIRMWYSNATTTTVDTSSSLYSQDHGNTNGSLNIYGDLHIATTTEYWSYATDFDGTALGGGSRTVNVFLASNATTTVDSGVLNIVGIASATTTITNQGTGNYSFNVNGGTFNATNYAFRNLDQFGLSISGTPVISSLNYGDFELAIDGGSLISLTAEALNANASLTIIGARLATTTAITGYNVNLNGSTASAWNFISHTGNLAGEAFDIDGIDNCGVIRWSDSACLLTEQTHYRWRNDDGGIDVPNSEWYDSNWNKRKRVQIANADATTYINAVVELLVPYNTDMQSDFNDLRFTDNSGTTTIPYFIASSTVGVAAEVWVKVPSLSSAETSVIFMYYNNATTTSNSSSTAVFIASDDFESNSISNYAGDTGLFTTSGSFAYAGSYGLDNVGNQNNKATDGIARFDQTVSQGEIIRYLQYIDTSTGSGDEVCTLFGVQTPVTSNNNYAVCLEQFGTDRLSLVKNAQNTDSSGTTLASSTISFTTGWYEVEIDWKVTDEISVIVKSGDTIVASTTATDSSYTAGGYGYTYWFNHGGWDNFSSRPRVENEPTIIFGEAQVDGGASWASNVDTPATNFTANQIARLRLAVENTGIAITDAYRLEYAPQGASPSCEAVSPATYVAVPPFASCGSAEVCMATSTNVTLGENITDLLFGPAGDYILGNFVEDTSNTSAPISISQNAYTEVEYAIKATSNITDQNLCFKVTDAGTDIDSYQRIAKLNLKFDPVFGAITLNGGNDISLTPGATTTIYATSTVTDYNGYADLLAGTSTIYRSGAGAACTPDNNNCYISSTDNSCSFSNCSGNTCDLSCSADIYFHADPTDLGDYVGEEWLSYMEVEDQSGGYDFASAIGVELITMRALTVDSAINYGSLAVNSDTGFYNATTTVENLGNTIFDIEIDGGNLTDGVSSVIPADEQKFSTSTFNYSACLSCSLASSTAPTPLNLGLAKPTVDTPPVSAPIYWGIAVPLGINSAPHTGTNVFTPVSP